MTDLRQQAIDLIESMPEENLLLIVGMLQGISEKTKPAPKKLIFTKEFLDKYMGSAGKIFGSKEEIDKYVEDLRSDRF